MEVVSHVAVFEFYVFFHAFMQSCANLVIKTGSRNTNKENNFSLFFLVTNKRGTALAGEIT